MNKELTPDIDKKTEQLRENRQAEKLLIRAGFVLDLFISDACEDLNHASKKMFHKYNEPCPVEALVKDTRIAIAKFLNGKRPYKIASYATLKVENERLREALRIICYEHPSRDTITDICEKALEGK